MADKSETPVDFALTCPIPIAQYPQVLMAHGGGGKLMHNLIERMFVSAFDNPLMEPRHDGAVFQTRAARMAFTTDSYVIQPLFFPGGDIGSLAVHGTVNDLAMCGARPLYLSVGFIIEEGLPMDTLWRIVNSIQSAAQDAQVQIATGDTKVVDRGKGDGIFINTAGVGAIEHDLHIAPDQIQTGDAIIVSGDIGRHGIAIMALREGLAFDTTIESDSAAVSGLVQELLGGGVEIRCMRDLTRGGLASAMIEIAEAANSHIHLDEQAIPVREDVRGACEILGFDPMYVANEGRFAVFVPESDVDKALAIFQAHPLGEGAAVIGQVTGETPRMVTLKSQIGATRIVDMLSGEQLPRIC
jgi:hydrogenase expression/formation protein HypE